MKNFFRKVQKLNYFVFFFNKKTKTLSKCACRRVHGRASFPRLHFMCGLILDFKVPHQKQVFNRQGWASNKFAGVITCPLLYSNKFLSFIWGVSSSSGLSQVQFMRIWRTQPNIVVYQPMIYAWFVNDISTMAPPTGHQAGFDANVSQWFLCDFAKVFSETYPC